MVQDMVQAGLRHQHQFLRDLGNLTACFDQAGRTHFDLPLGFFSGNVKECPVLSDMQRSLQQEGGFADAGVTADEDHGSGDDPAPEHLGQFGNAGLNTGLSQFVDVLQAARDRLGQSAGNDPGTAAGRCRRELFFDLLDHGAEGTASRAAPHELRAGPSAFLTYILGHCLCHMHNYIRREKE